MLQSDLNTPNFEMPRFLKSKIFNILPPNVLDSFFEGSQLVSCFREGKDHQPATIDSLIDSNRLESLVFIPES